MFKSLLNIFKPKDYKIISYKFTQRCWGNDFQLQRKHDEDGNLWTIALWNKEEPTVGDILLLGIEPDRNVGYKICSVKPCGDPSDMYFVDAKFVRKETYERKLKEIA